MISEYCKETVLKTETKVMSGINYKYELRSFKSKNVASFGIVLYEIYVETQEKDRLNFYRTGGLFSDLEKAIRFFEKVTRNFATPYNLPYIVEDSFLF